MLMGLGPTGAAGQEEFCATTGHQTTGDSFLDDGFSAGIRFVIAGLHRYFKWVLENNRSQTLLDRAATSTDVYCTCSVMFNGELRYEYLLFPLHFGSSGHSLHLALLCFGI
jgi:hypothetical protein